MIENSEFHFEDAETFRGNYDDKISFKIIVLNQLQKISLNSNVEFRGGYWQQKAIPMQGGVTKITEEYIPDTREVYSNSIEYLHDILFPHFQKNKKMMAASKEYHDKINGMLKEFMKDGKFDDEEKVIYRQERIRLCRDLFISLNIFLEEKNYFSERSN